MSNGWNAKRQFPGYVQQAGEGTAVTDNGPSRDQQAPGGAGVAEGTAVADGNVAHATSVQPIARPARRPMGIVSIHSPSVPRPTRLDPQPTWTKVIHQLGLDTCRGMAWTPPEEGCSCFSCGAPARYIINSTEGLHTWCDRDACIQMAKEVYEPREASGRIEMLARDIEFMRGEFIFGAFTTTCKGYTQIRTRTGFVRCLCQFCEALRRAAVASPLEQEARCDARSKAPSNGAQGVLPRSRGPPSRWNDEP